MENTGGKEGRVIKRESTGPKGLYGLMRREQTFVVAPLAPYLRTMLELSVAAPLALYS